MELREIFLERVHQIAKENGYYSGAILTNPALWSTLQEKIIFYLRWKSKHVSGDHCNLFNYLFYLYSKPLREDEAIHLAMLYDKAFDMIDEYFSLFIDSLTMINMQFLTYIEKMANTFFVSINTGDLESAREILDKIEQLKKDAS